MDCRIAIDVPAFEILLQQRVVGSTDRLDEILPIAREPVAALRGNVRFEVFALHAGVIEICTLREEIDHPAEIRAAADRDLDGDDLVGESRLDLRVDPIEVGVFAVHHRDRKEHGILSCDGRAEHAFGAHFHAAGGPDDAEDTVRGGQSGQCVALKVERSRRVNEIDLAVHPFGACTAECN